MKRNTSRATGCCQTPRRMFLADVGMGFTGLALGALLQRDGIVRGEETWTPPTGKPHHAPRAKTVIWVFLSGGYSQMETFDPKPALNKYAGKTFQQTPYEDPFQSPLHDIRSRSVIEKVREKYATIFPMQVGYKKHGQNGIGITDWWPHLASCVDDLTFVRNMWTTDNDHAAENQIHTGRHKLDEIQPSIGAWVKYGLGSINDNLPQFVVLGGPTRADTRKSFEANYLGPEHEGVPLALDPKNPLPYGKRGPQILADEQRHEFELINQLNGLAQVEYPDDANLRARIQSYELAYRMQTAVPEAIEMTQETAATQKLYGLDQASTKVAGQRLLAARRLAERGVRFIQVYPTPYGKWDSHKKLKSLHAQMSEKVDKPIAGLIKDLKQRAMLDDVVVVFCTEFGRTPAIEERSGGTDGRDHHPHGFTVWLAGAGLKPGYVHGATDELGFHALPPGHYVTDLHATVLDLMGLDGRRLTIPGRKRLEIDHGQPIRDLYA
ncbi:MAG: DUF1501 domain-containing protein [Pirellulaceae bacterium]